MSEADLNLNSEDMIQFWRDGFMSNPILKFRQGEAFKHAEDMYRRWEIAGICFAELLRDFKAANYYQSSPVNERTGIDWHTLLVENMKGLKNGTTKNPAAIFPHILVQSTVKYFKSKGPALTKGSILDEEKERLRLMDAKMIMLRRPSNIEEIKNFEGCVKGFFPGYLHLILQKRYCKLVYPRRSAREKDRHNHRNNEFKWPHNQERMEIINPEKCSMNYQQFLEDEIIDTELVISNVTNLDKMSQLKITKDLGIVFPEMKDFELCHESYKIIIKFENPKDTFKGFKNGKDFMFFHGSVNVIYNRKPSKRGVPGKGRVQPFQPSRFDEKHSRRSRSRSPLRREKINNEPKNPSPERFVKKNKKRSPRRNEEGKEESMDSSQFNEKQSRRSRSRSPLRRKEINNEPKNPSSKKFDEKNMQKSPQGKEKVKEEMIDFAQFEEKQSRRSRSRSPLRREKINNEPRNPSPKRFDKKSKQISPRRKEEVKEEKIDSSRFDEKHSRRSRSRSPLRTEKINNERKNPSSKRFDEKNKQSSPWRKEKVKEEIKEERIDSSPRVSRG